VKLAADKKRMPVVGAAANVPVKAKITGSVTNSKVAD
jgi:hypothetical protein